MLTGARAQTAKNQFEESLPDSIKYVMPAFGQGVIVYKDGSHARGLFNISTVDQSLRFKEANGTEKILINVGQVDRVTISSVAFLNAQEMFLGVVDYYNNDVILCVNKRLVFDDRKTGGYGLSSASSSIQTVGTTSQTGNTYTYTNIKYEVKETPYLYKKGRLYACTKKNITKFFPDKKEAVESYLQENKVDFSNYKQVEALMEVLK